MKREVASVIYQPLRTGSAPYVAGAFNLVPVPMHFHHEIELLYCVSGSYEATVSGISYRVNAGELLLAGSMAPHEIVASNARVLLLDIGPILLKEHFDKFSPLDRRGRLYSFESEESEESEGSEGEKCRELKRLLDDTARLCTERGELYDLRILGNIYGICAEVLGTVDTSGQTEPEKKLHESVERALELIYYHYKDNVTVEDAARLAGYGKSSFCALFKNAVGMSFHAYLNAFRIENARYLLSRTGESVEKVASLVGFADAKSFCRAFKKITGQTPASFRKNGKAKPEP